MPAMSFVISSRAFKIQMYFRLGGDVSKALRECFGVELKWAENGRLPEYFVVLGALLKR